MSSISPRWRRPGGDCFNSRCWGSTWRRFLLVTWKEERQSNRCYGYVQRNRHCRLWVCRSLIWSQWNSGLTWITSIDFCSVRQNRASISTLAAGYTKERVVFQSTGRLRWWRWTVQNRAGSFLRLRLGHIASNLRAQTQLQPPHGTRQVQWQVEYITSSLSS